MRLDDYNSPDQLPWKPELLRHQLGSNEVTKSDVISFMKEHGTNDWLATHKLNGKLVTLLKTLTNNAIVSAYADFADKQCTDDSTLIPSPKKLSRLVSTASTNLDPADAVLSLVTKLFQLSFEAPVASAKGAGDVPRIQIDKRDFVSSKLTKKLRQQMMDYLVIATGALPEWCTALTASTPILFPFEIRHQLFQSTAFGLSRSIAWIQNKHAADRQAANGGKKPDDGQEFRIGRLKHDRIFVRRGDEVIVVFIDKILD